MLKKYGPRFLTLPLGAIKHMIAARIKSVFLLANDIYLKQIRRMYYSDVFTSTVYQPISIQNAIYDLSRVNFKDTDPSDPFSPSDDMITLAEQARMMGTTLWFDSNNQSAEMKKAIVVTGQFTTCYNLLKYISRLEQTNTGNHTATESELTQLKRRLEADYVKFKTKADFMY